VVPNDSFDRLGYDTRRREVYRNFSFPSPLLFFGMQIASLPPSPPLTERMQVWNRRERVVAFGRSPVWQISPFLFLFVPRGGGGGGDGVFGNNCYNDILYSSLVQGGGEERKRRKEKNCTRIIKDMQARIYR